MASASLDRQTSRWCCGVRTRSGAHTQREPCPLPAALWRDDATAELHLLTSTGLGKKEIQPFLQLCAQNYKQKKTQSHQHKQDTEQGTEEI